MLTLEEIIYHEKLKLEYEEKLQDYNKKLRDFGQEFFKFVTNTKVGDKRIVPIRDGYLDSINICIEENNDPSKLLKVCIIINSFEDDEEIIYLPIEILWDENWRQTIIDRTYKEREEEIKKEEEYKCLSEAKKLEEEKQLYLKLKEKFEKNA